MLTGDKIETAINIAKSCNLIQADYQIYHLTLLQHHLLEQKKNKTSWILKKKMIHWKKSLKNKL